MPKERIERPFADLGMAAAAFAALLVVVGVEHRSPELLHAVGFFSVSIPLCVAAAFLRMVAGEQIDPGPRSLVQMLRIFCGAAGNLGCGIGLYWVLRHVSVPAARHFLITAIVCYIGVFVLDMGLGRPWRKRTKAVAAEVPRADQNDWSE